MAGPDKGRWNPFRRPKQEIEPEAQAGPGDLPRVVTTTTIGRLSHGRGNTRLGFGGGPGIRAGDLTDLILPVILIGGALLFTQRACKWHAGDLGDYTPARALPSLSSGRNAAPGAPWGSSPRTREVRPQAKSNDKGRSVPVVLDVEVDEHGTPRAIRVVRGAGGTVDQRAIDQAKTMQYQAAQRGGRGEASHIEVTLWVPLD
jgi:hypothetical protein